MSRQLRLRLRHFFLRLRTMRAPPPPMELPFTLVLSQNSPLARRRSTRGANHLMPPRLLLRPRSPSWAQLDLHEAEITATTSALASLLLLLQANNLHHSSSAKALRARSSQELIFRHGPPLRQHHLRLLRLTWMSLSESLRHVLYPLDTDPPWRPSALALSRVSSARSVTCARRRRLFGSAFPAWALITPSSPPSSFRGTSPCSRWTRSRLSTLSINQLGKPRSCSSPRSLTGSRPTRKTLSH